MAQKLKDHSKLEEAVRRYCGKNAIPFKKPEGAELATGESEDEASTNLVRHAGFTLSGIFNTTTTSTDYPLRDSILLDPLFKVDPSILNEFPIPDVPEEDGVIGSAFSALM